MIKLKLTGDDTKRLEYSMNPDHAQVLAEGSGPLCQFKLINLYLS